MANGFYVKLAGSNLARNRRMYGPYCVASALMSGMFFIILNLVFSRSIANLQQGPTVQTMFRFGITVMSLFTVGYMLYINSFLIKRRKKEFGLYGVLGMERRHVARVILWENAFTSFGSLLLGLIGGAIFGRIAFMLLLNLLDTAQGSTYVLTTQGFILTAVIFCAIFGLTTLYNLNQVRLASPVDLLKGENKGEKKVRLVIPMTFLGLIMLGAAYYIAITVNNNVVALMYFWPAVILVIGATWFLFTGGSVFVLGALKRNRRLYYKPGNFISISGLIHRMKQNAAGLANICILSTMVMVTVSCCCALYFGQENILKGQNPDDIRLSISLEDEAAARRVMEETEALAYQMAERQGVTVESRFLFRYASNSVILSDGELHYRGMNAEDMNDYYALMVVPLEDYNALLNRQETLNKGEALLLTNSAAQMPQTIPLGEGALTVKAVEADTPFTRGKNSVMDGRLCAVVADDDVAFQVMRAMNPGLEKLLYTHMLYLNVDGDTDTCLAYATALRDAFRQMGEEAVRAQSGNYRTDNIFTNRFEGYSLYGGLLFLGAFFTILFLINTVLILYFKQISEGFDDSGRFSILQKVGLSDKEVKGTINRQMLIVFLLPLVAALLHMAAAGNMMTQMLGSFMLTDFGLTLTCILVTCAVFAAVYLCVYRITARTYYRLVKW